MTEQEAEAIATQIVRKVEKRILETLDFPPMMIGISIAALCVDLRDEIKQLIRVPPR